MSQPISVSVQMMLHPSTILSRLRPAAPPQGVAPASGVHGHFAGVCLCLPVAGGPERRRSPAHGGSGRGGAGRAGRLFLDVLPLPEPPNQKDGPAPPLLPAAAGRRRLSVWMAGEQDKPEASRKYAWHDMHLAYRTPNAIYLYVQQNQAYLLNDSLDAAWSLLQAFLPAERLHDMR